MIMFKAYEKMLTRGLSEAEITDREGTGMMHETAFASIFSRIFMVKKNDNKVMFIGNGGSASIASHMAVDFWKNGGVKARVFNDAAQLTCLANDYGYEYVFSKPIEEFAGKGDVLIAISSSGKSINIINGVKAAVEKQCWVLTLSGFSDENPLRTSGDLNIYIRDNSYGIVETSHMIICHYIMDNIYSNIAGKE